MNSLMLVLLQAQGQQGGGWSMIIMLVAIFAIMYFFMIRPQQKQRKELMKFRNSIEVGQQVVTGGGIYGKVTQINDEDNTFTLEIATGVKIKIDKNMVFKDLSSAQAK